jgi:DNA-binding MarR family transcriptional regulator
VSVLAFREKHDGDLVAPPDQREAVRLWLRLLSCTMVIEKRVRRGLAEQFRTTLPRFDILAALDRAAGSEAGGLSMSGLSAALKVSNGNITGLVQTLLKDGDVAMGTAPGDRRTALVEITPQGRRRFAEMAAAHHQWIADVMAGLGAAETQALHALLGRLQASITAAPDIKGDL